MKSVKIEIKLKSFPQNVFSTVINFESAEILEHAFPAIYSSILQSEVLTTISDNESGEVVQQ